MEPNWIQDDASRKDKWISMPPKGGQWCTIEAMFILSNHLTGENWYNMLIIPHQLKTVIVFRYISSPSALFYDCMNIVHCTIKWWSDPEGRWDFRRLYVRQIYLTLYINKVFDLLNSEARLDRMVCFACHFVYFSYDRHRWRRSIVSRIEIPDSNDGRETFQVLQSQVPASHLFV